MPLPSTAGCSPSAPRRPLVARRHATPSMTGVLDSAQGPRALAQALELPPPRPGEGLPLVVGEVALTLGNDPAWFTLEDVELLHDRLTAGTSCVAVDPVPTTA